MEDGSGLEDLIPPLQSSAALTSPSKLACVIRHGPGPSTIDSTLVMPAFDKLTNAEIANISNYIYRQILKHPVFVSDRQIESFLKDCN